MSAIPERIETDRQPPLAIPMAHFVVALVFLLLGGFSGAAAGANALPGMAMLAHTHLLLAGWVCVTIMGAMTQFVPVWSGVALHSHRLAAVQLYLVTAGLLGFATVFVVGPLELLALPAALMLAGFWVFAYNVGRTLLAVDRPDVTEIHFGIALGWFLVLTGMGMVLAASYARPGLFLEVGLDRLQFRMAHATAAVFGAVLTTVIGALYQLGEMFTQAAHSRVDDALQHIETASYPFGVTALVAGRVFGIELVAAVGGVLAIVGLLATGVVLARRLLYAQTEWSPVLSRYSVVAVSLLSWGLLALPAWLERPLAYEHLFGAPEARNLLIFGVLVFVLVGSIYHVIPFLLWLERYSDRIGLEDVPMVEDLYSARLAAVDFWAVLLGSATFVAGDLFGLPPVTQAVGGTLTTVGFVVFAANMLLVVRGHSPFSLREMFLGGLGRKTGDR
ncbi:MAG: hypothetical protein ACOCY1_02085 [Halovenus sp.]